MSDSKPSVDFGGLFLLLLVSLCMATCDECSACRDNAKSLYCEVPS